MNLQNRAMRNRLEKQNAALIWSYMIQETNCIKSRALGIEEDKLNSEVYSLKINMVCRMSEAMNMRLGNSKSI